MFDIGLIYYLSGVNMEIVFSDHAKAQTKERNLSEDLVLRTIKNPDKVIKQSGKRYRVQKRVRQSGKIFLLIAVYDLINGTGEIVTAFLTTKFKKYL